jgi:tetratricopeptide (TPR) repeat protein
VLGRVIALNVIFLAIASSQTQPVPQSSVQRAAAQIRSGDFQGARETLERALTINSRDPNLWNLLGIAEGELHDIPGARSAFEHGLRLAPDSLSLHENLGLLFFRNGNYPDAKRVLAQALSLGSTNTGVRFSLASAELRTGEPERALSNFRSLEQPLGGLAAYWDERGRAESVSHPADAEKSFSRALELQPDDLVALNGAASAAERQGLDEKALAYLIRARQSHPADVVTLTHFGAVCIRRDLGLDAVDALNKAHQLDRNNNSTLFLLARANISLTNWQAAYDLFSEFVKRVPNYAPAYYAMGWIDTKLDRTDDARRQLQHALQLDSKLIGARFELAELELSNGDLQAAQAALKVVLEQEPKHAKANLAMGDLLMRTGKLDQAKSYLQTAVQSDPALAAAHYKLAMLYLREHDPQHADSEKAIAAKLNAAADQASKTQLKLILPEDTTLE